MNKLKKYLKWFPIAGLSFSSYEDEMKLKVAGLIYMVYQSLCCISFLLLLLLISYNL